MSDEQAAVRKENHVLRSFCALIIFCIVFVHYEPCFQLFGMEAHEFVIGVGRFAMPMFFMISGYFLYSDDGHSERDLKRKTLRILFLAIFMKLLYTVLDLIYYATGVIPYDELMEGLILSNWSSKHIWFIYFLFFVYLLHWIFYRYHIDFKYAMFIGFICLIIELFCADVCAWAGIVELFGLDMFSIGQFAYCLIAFFFFPLGYYLHKHKDRTEGWSTPLLLALVVIGSAMSAWEVLNFQSTGFSYSSLYFGSVVIAIPLFILTFRVPEDRLRCRPLEFMGRTLLPWMYAFYMAVIFFIKFVVMDSIDAPIELLDAIGIIVSAISDVVLAYGMYRFALYLREKMGGRAANLEARKV